MEEQHAPHEPRQMTEEELWAFVEATAENIAEDHPELSAGEVYLEAMERADREGSAFWLQHGDQIKLNAQAALEREKRETIRRIFEAYVQAGLMTHDTAADRFRFSAPRDQILRYSLEHPELFGAFKSVSSFVEWLTQDSDDLGGAA